jgi:hypothetical protein
MAGPAGRKRRKSFAILEAALIRLIALRLKRPHDGIVEEASNHLAKCPRSTEKSDSYGGPRGGRPATYAHLTLAACSEVNHIQIHADPIIVDVISELIAMKFFGRGTAARNLEDWFANLSPETRLAYDARMFFNM